MLAQPVALPNFIQKRIRVPVALHDPVSHVVIINFAWVQFDVLKILLQLELDPVHHRQDAAVHISVHYSDGRIWLWVGHKADARGLGLRVFHQKNQTDLSLFIQSIYDQFIQRYCPTSLCLSKQYRLIVLRRQGFSVLIKNSNNLIQYNFDLNQLATELENIQQKSTLTQLEPEAFQKQVGPFLQKLKSEFEPKYDRLVPLRLQVVLKKHWKKVRYRFHFDRPLVELQKFDMVPFLESLENEIISEIKNDDHDKTVLSDASAENLREDRLKAILAQVQASLSIINLSQISESSASSAPQLNEQVQGIISYAKINILASTIRQIIVDSFESTLNSMLAYSILKSLPEKNQSESVFKTYSKQLKPLFILYCNFCSSIIHAEDGCHNNMYRDRVYTIVHALSSDLEDKMMIKLGIDNCYEVVENFMHLMNGRSQFSLLDASTQLTCCGFLEKFVQHLNCYSMIFTTNTINYHFDFDLALEIEHIKSLLKNGNPETTSHWQEVLDRLCKQYEEYDDFCKINKLQVRRKFALLMNQNSNIIKEYLEQGFESKDVKADVLIDHRISMLAQLNNHSLNRIEFFRNRVNVTTISTNLLKEIQKQSYITKYLGTDEDWRRFVTNLEILCSLIFSKSDDKLKGIVNEQLVLMQKAYLNFYLNEFWKQLDGEVDPLSYQQIQLSCLEYRALCEELSSKSFTYINSNLCLQMRAEQLLKLVYLMYIAIYQKEHDAKSEVPIFLINLSQILLSQIVLLVKQSNSVPDSQGNTKQGGHLAIELNDSLDFTQVLQSSIDRIHRCEIQFQEEVIPGKVSDPFKAKHPEMKLISVGALEGLALHFNLLSNFRDQNISQSIISLSPKDIISLLLEQKNYELALKYTHYTSKDYFPPLIWSLELLSVSPKDELECMQAIKLVLQYAASDGEVDVYLSVLFQYLSQVKRQSGMDFTNFYEFLDLQSIHPYSSICLLDALKESGLTESLLSHLEKELMSLVESPRNKQIKYQLWMIIKSKNYLEKDFLASKVSSSRLQHIVQLMHTLDASLEYRAAPISEMA